MKKIVLFVFVICVNLLSAQNVNFGPSSVFRQRVLSSNASGGVAYDAQGNSMVVDTNSDGAIQISEALQVSELRFQTINFEDGLTGLSSFANLKTLKLIDTDIITINLQSQASLKNLEVRGDAFTGVNLTGLTNLETIKIMYTKMAGLNVSGLSALKTLDIGLNILNNTLDLSGLTSLEYVDASSNGIDAVVLTGAVNLKTLKINHNNITALNLAGLENSLTLLACGLNQLTSLNLEGFIKLKVAECSNNHITQLSIGSLEKLEELSLTNNNVSELQPEGLQQLTYLSANGNNLASINLQNNPALKYVNVDGNNITGLFAVHNLPSLKLLHCAHNQITSVSFQGLPALERLDCSYNQLTTIDLSALTFMSNLNCDHNLLTTLSLDGISTFAVSCNYNLLTSLYLKNGFQESVSFSGNPNLVYICADEVDLSTIDYNLFQYNQLTTVNVNSYCNDLPLIGNHLTGSVKFYNNQWGTGIGRPLPYTLINADGEWLSSNQQGMYHHFEMNTASGYVAPFLENPDLIQTQAQYYSFSSSQGEEVEKNLICYPGEIAAADVETFLIPLAPPRPGENIPYRLVIRNKGNINASGNLTLSYDNSVLQLLSATPVQNAQNGNVLNWAYADLLPMETRYYQLSFHLNSPMDTPPVSSNYWLNYNANISLLNGSDHKPDDNSWVSHDVVVNSFDPNDKTCLEGGTILPSAAGKYVHYVIRFENTGTAPAQRIVVSDLIDTTKFDLYSLVPLSSSHNFRLAMRNSTADFIFENINLPFEDGSNDGYVAFKIKTLPSLVAGNSFSNKASIYFDYNFPIITNTATTTLSVLAADSRNSESIFTVYPNPVHNSLKLAVKSGIAVNAVSVYNALGQLVLALPKNAATESIDLSMLQAGNYFVKLATDHGTAVKSIIKE